MVVLKNKWVHVKLTSEERETWQAAAAAEGLTLADLIRKRMGEARQVGRDPRKRRAARRADPALLALLGRIASNLNQIAKWANTYKKNAEALQVVQALISIEGLFSSYRPSSTSTAAGEDDHVS